MTLWVRQRVSHPVSSSALATLIMLTVWGGLVERAIAQASSAAASSPAVTEPLTKQPQFYQDYQSMPAVAEPPVPPTTPVRRTVSTVQPTSFTEPVWVMPGQPSAPPPAKTDRPNQAGGFPGTGSTDELPPPSRTPTAPPVSVPRPAADPVQAEPPPPPRSPSRSGEAAVVVLGVNVVGVAPDLQDVVRRSIKTQPGGSTDRIQLDQDIAEIFATGLFADASYSLQTLPQGVNVTFQVAPMVVRSVRLMGARALTPEVANDFFKSQIGQPVSPTALTQTVQQINQWYTQNGYTLARVLTLQPTRDGIITVEVAEGTIGELKLRFFNREGKPVDDQGRPIRPRTQESLIRDQIQLRPGQVFREDVARQDLNRISRLGLFEQATITFEGDARRTDVVYNLVERPPRAINFGGGFNDDLGLFATVNFQDSNVAGLGQVLGGNLQIGTRDIQFDGRFRSPYRESQPNIPGYGADVFRRQVLSRIFDEDIRLPNGSQVRERRVGGGLSLEQPIAPEWRGSLSLNYTNISLRDRDGNIFATDIAGNPLSLSGTGIDDLTTLAFTATRERRDNPINPAKGDFLSVTAEQSIPVGRGSVLGTKVQANYAYYIPVDWLSPAPDPTKPPPSDRQPEVLALNVQGGTNFGDLPPYNAYSLGGPTSVRGYDIGDVASSRSYVLLSAEYRFPVYRFIGGVAFLDYATDLSSSDNVLGQPGIQRGKPGNGLGFGVGLRVNSPIGIIRADFGINDQGDSRIQFGFGQRF